MDEGTSDFSVMEDVSDSEPLPLGARSYGRETSDRNGVFTVKKYRQECRRSVWAVQPRSLSSNPVSACRILTMLTKWSQAQLPHL